MAIITCENVFDFCRTYDWQKRLDELETILLPERWNFIHPLTDARNTNNPILENYIKYTFKRVHQIEQEDESIACFIHERCYVQRLLRCLRRR